MYDKKEFIELAKQQSPEELADYIPCAVEILGELGQEHGEYYRAKVADFILFAGRLAPLLAKEKGRERVSFPVTSQDVLTSDFLANKITPWVEMVRERLFGSPQAPFQSIKEAIEWIEHEGQRGLDEETKKKAKKLMATLIGITHWSIAAKTLQYPGEDGQLKVVMVWAGSALELLADQTLEMMRATGFEQASLVMYILTVYKPLLRRVKLTKHTANYLLPTGGALRPVSLTLDIKARDLDFEDLRRIYGSIREQLQVKKGKPLNERHHKLVQIVQEKGGAPKPNEKGTVAFWTSVMDEVNKWYRNTLLEGKDRHYKNWRAAKKAYNDLNEKLKTHSGWEPGVVSDESIRIHKAKRGGKRK
jgi:hypothetical protein